MRALTSKLCAEVWKTRYECSLNPGKENSKLEMETPKFLTKIDVLDQTGTLSQVGTEKISKGGWTI